MKKVIAVTGVIGSGKSTVADFLRSKGEFVADCDKISREVADLPDVLTEISRKFGEGFVRDGVLDRRALAAEVFGSPKKTEVLNDLFHPRIKRRLEQIVADRDGLIFVEIPLLEESFKPLFDAVWVVTADEKRILSRVSARDKRPSARVKDILDRQNRYADIPSAMVITNNGTLYDLYEKTEKNLSALYAEGI